MSEASLVYPMGAMVLLTFSVLVRLFAKRVGFVRDRSVDPRYFQTYQEGAEPESSAKLSRNFSNQFEAPVLFYVACLAAMATGQVTSTVLALAWLYFALRLVHCLIHTGPNVLYPRIAAYFSSWAVLLALWVRVVVGVALEWPAA